MRYIDPDLNYCPKCDEELIQNLKEEEKVS